jgi:hypothetical protein
MAQCTWQQLCSISQYGKSAWKINMPPIYSMVNPMINLRVHDSSVRPNYQVS